MAEGVKFVRVSYGIDWLKEYPLNSEGYAAFLLGSTLTVRRNQIEANAI